jgi:hypothetical protein
MANTAPSADWQSRLKQSQAARQAQIQRLTQKPAILRNAMLDTPLGEAEGKVCTVGDALRFEQYLSIPSLVITDSQGRALPLAEALADKREEIDANSGKYIDALLNTRAGPTPTHRRQLCSAVLEFCGMLELAVHSREANDDHPDQQVIRDSSRYPLALSLRKAIPEIERALRHAKDRINGSAAPLVGKCAPASR